MVVAADQCHQLHSDRRAGGVRVWLSPLALRRARARRPDRPYPYRRTPAPQRTMTAPGLPLVADFPADAAMAWPRNRMCTQGEYVAQVQRLGAQLPSSRPPLKPSEKSYRILTA